MIVKRPFWQKIIEKAWEGRTIIWLMGLRRVGKTSLCKSLDNMVYFDCELPSVRRDLADPEKFLKEQSGKRIILDEIHILDNPSQVLKIAADHYPDVKIIATGSSTLGASKKFRDTLTGRKREVYLTPLFIQEMDLFGNNSLKHRFLFGGFPSFFVADHLPLTNFAEWITSYWAKDIVELFTVGKRSSFIKFYELLFAQSGGIFEATKFTTPCEVSRPTIANYLAILEETFVVSVIKPYSKHKRIEITSAPKVYGMDTGFVCFAKGWTQLRDEDLGFMWEHCILNEIQGHLQVRRINYWRDKSGHEIDFVITERGERNLTAIECKYTMFIDDTTFTSIGKNFEALRKLYPVGDNFIVASNIDRSYTRDYKGLTITFVSSAELIKQLENKPIWR